MKIHSERRQANQSTTGDRLTKQLIVFTVCSIALLVTITMCRLALNQSEPPDAIDRLANLAIGALIGWIGKTGVDAVQSQRNPDADATTNVQQMDVSAEQVDVTREKQPEA